MKIAIFLAYLILCSKQKDIYRVFQYHGAEHKTIFCYEAGLPLTVENVRIQPRHHPRCGTSFLFVVIFVSILVSSVVFGIWPITNAGLRTLVHLLLLPLVVGITYEFNRWVGRHVQDSKLAQFLTAPGLWMQNFTTNEPDDSMIECAIRSSGAGAAQRKGQGRVVTIIKYFFRNQRNVCGRKRRSKGVNAVFATGRNEVQRTLRRRMAITYNDLFLDIRRELKQGGVIDTTLEARELTFSGA